MENKCLICPRKCGIDRTKSFGFCFEGEQLQIAKIVPHFRWEEPCLSDEKGVLAIFFSGCNLKCEFCQNIEISRGGVGKIFTTQEFVDLINKEQQNHSAIDLVTPTHFAKALCKAFEKIEKKVPVIWNSNAYESVETLQEVGKFVDIFLPDFKYATNIAGQKFSACKDYFSFALPAIKEMCRQKKDVFDEDGKMKQGVIIRHLVLPKNVENSLEILDTIKAEFPDRMLSLMSQFTPNGHGTLDRKITPIEYKLVLSHLEKLGLEKGYIQDFESADKCFVPNFEQPKE